MDARASVYVPQCVTPDATAKRAYAIWGVIATAALLWIGLILAAPAALAYGYPSLSLILYRAFSYLCHQIPERSFLLLGHPLAVCARCFGLYVGFATGVAIYPLFRSLRDHRSPALVWLALSILPTAIDFGLGYLGILENTHTSRFLTGMLPGAASAFYVIPGLVELCQGHRPLSPSQPSNGNDAVCVRGSAGAE